VASASYFLKNTTRIRNDIVYEDPLKLQRLYLVQRSVRLSVIEALTLRLLMSYIYMERLFLMFLDHTQRRKTVGRTPLDE